MDPKASLRSALAQLRKIAASQLARKEKIEASFEALTTQHAELKSRRKELASADGGPLARELDTALPNLEAQLESVRQELAQAELDLEESLRHLKDSDGMERQLDRALLQRKVRELSQSDPYSPSAEDIALANAREAIQEAAARVDVTRELQGESTSVAPDLDERARAELERLKAERAAKKTGPSEPTSD